MTPTDDFIGTERFDVLRRLGAGAFGVVYEVRDRERESVVALKLLRQADAGPLYLFKREFRTLADVVHPNLVTLHELLSDGGRWFFTMELVEGTDFQKYVLDPQAPRSSSRDDVPASDLPTGGYCAPLSSDDTPTEHMSLSRPSSDETPTGDVSDLPTSNIKSLVKVRESGRGIAAQTADDMPTTDVSDLSARSLSPDGNSRVVVQPATVRAWPRFHEGRLRAALKQLVEGVNALHEAGKLHRDLKPSNVLVTPEGRVVILDFGLVADSRDVSGSRENEIIGTPAYMSPEQAAGRELTPASDLYTIGVMLYEAMTGKLVFTGDTYAILRQKRQSIPVPPDAHVFNLPPDLSRLCCDLLERDPKKRPSASEVMRRLSPTNDGEPSETGTDPESAAVRFVGRETHLKRLRDAFDASGGQPVVARVHGRSGMGKSVLAERFLDDLREIGPLPLILSGRCYEQESVPYKAFDGIADALSRHLKRLVETDPDFAVPSDMPALAKLFPVLHQLETRSADIPDSQELRRRAFAVLRTLFGQLAAREPLVVHIDDLQWGDVDSALLLGELLRPPDPPSFLLVAGYRSEEAGTSPFLKTFLPKLADKTATAARVDEIEVGQLTPDDAREIVRGILGDDEHAAERAEAIVRESGGSPFFVNELARHAQTAPIRVVAGDTRAALDAVIRERVKRLPDAARRMLEVIAVAGQPVERRVVRRASKAGAGEQVAFTVLRSNHFIRVRKSEALEEVEPYHDRIREAVEQGLDADRLKRRHYRLAVELEASGRVDPETLAVHYREGGERRKAARYAATAADQASEATAFDRAARLYRMALELRDEDDKTRPLLVKLGNALANAGRGAESAETYLRAAELPETDRSKEPTLELRRRAAEQFLTSGHMDKGLKLTDDVLGAVGLRLAPTPGRAMMSLVLRRLWLLLRGLGFRERPEADVPSEELLKLDICWSVAVGLVFVDNIRSVEFQARYLLLALKAGEPFRVARGVNMFTCSAAVTGGRDLSRTRKLYEAAVEMAERVQHPYTLGMVKVTSGLIAFYTGRWRESMEQFDLGEAVLRARCTGVTWELNTSRYYALRAMFFLGDLKQLADQATALIQNARERGDVYAMAGLRLRYGYLTFLIADDIDLARSEIEDGIRLWTSQGYHIQHFFHLAAQVEIALYAGEGRRAWDVLAERWAAFSKSLLFRVQTLLIEFHHQHARGALAAAASESDPEQREWFLREAERDTRQIEKENMTWCRGVPDLIRAGTASARGDADQAVRLLDLAEKHFGEADMALHATAARYRRGQLVKGEDGRALIQEASNWMTDRDIRSPRRMVEMLVPGVFPD